MKRTLAIVVLVSALAVLFKLALKPGAVADRSSSAAKASGSGGIEKPAPAEPEVETVLLLKYPWASERDRALVARVAGRFGATPS